MTNNGARLLLELMASGGTVCPRDMLMDALKAHDHVSAHERLDKTVDVYVTKVRAQLRKRGFDGVIVTVWGLGYRIAGQDTVRLRAAIGLDGGGE